MPKTLKIILFIFTISFSKLNFAQDFVPFGKFNKEEIELTECGFDKEAEAVVLLHEGYSDYSDRYELVTQHHIRIKILKESGIKHADVSIPFYSKNDFEILSNIKGVIYYKGEYGYKTEEINQKQIFKKQLNDLYSEIKFTFPKVAVGSIIEYSYTSTMKSYSGLDEWVFQREIPTLISRYTLSILPNVEFKYAVQKNINLPINIKPDNANGKISYSMNNIAGLRNEPYMDTYKDYIQKVSFQLSVVNGGFGDKHKYMNSWKDMINELMEDQFFGKQLKKEIPGTEDFIKEVSLLVNKKERLRKILTYVQSHLSWNTFYSKYFTEGIKEVWKKKTGTNSEINLTLINLLKAANLEAYPILVSTRKHGKVYNEIPFIDQFNAVYVYVLLDEKVYYINAISESQLSVNIPSEILNTNGLLVKKDGGLIKIVNEDLMYKRNYFLSVTLNEDSISNATLDISNEAYAKVENSGKIKEDKGKYVKEQFMRSDGLTDVINYTFNNLESDSLALLEKADLRLKFQRTGEYLFIPLNLTSEFEDNPFKSENRFSSINYGYKKSYLFRCNISFNNKWLPDVFPKSIRITNPEKTISYSRQIQYDPVNKTISFVWSIQILNSLFLAEDYTTLKEFYKQMFNYLEEPIVFKKIN